MRTYALYQCNRRILWLLILTAAIAILGGGVCLSQFAITHVINIVYYIGCIAGQRDRYTCRTDRFAEFWTGEL